MKKIGVGILALVLLLGLCGCSDRPTITSDTIDEYMLFDENTMENTYVGPMIWEDDVAKEFAETVILGLDETIDTENIASFQTTYDVRKELYRVTKETTSGRSYSMELWLYKTGQLTINNVYIDDKLISKPYIVDSEHAERVADVIMTAVYNVSVNSPIDDVYPDIESSPRGSTGWWVSRCEADTFGSSMHIMVDAEGVLFDLTWGGE